MCVSADLCLCIWWLLQEKPPWSMEQLNGTPTSGRHVHIHIRCPHTNEDAMRTGLAAHSGSLLAQPTWNGHCYVQIPEQLSQRLRAAGGGAL